VTAHNLSDRQREALRMLDVFASVGMRQLDITFTDMDGHKRGFRPAQPIELARASMRSTLIQSCVARGTNIIMRPHPPPPVLLIQLDDLDSAALARVTPAAFLILATSPGNHQAWLAVEGGSGADFARRVRKSAAADPSASGAVRVAGSVNFKRKYEPNFPTVAILEARAGRVVSAIQVDVLGLVAPEDPPKEASRRLWRPNNKWPSYQRCIEGAPLAHGSERRDISRADFTWCVIAVDWGHSIEETAARLMEESPKARNNGKAYAHETAAHAAYAVWQRIGCK
jgi:hypothetical protein